MTLLSIENLSVAFGTSEVVHGVSFTVDKGETVALVGESGSGKSVTALSILRLLPYPHASHPSGKIVFDNQIILNRGEEKSMCPPPLGDQRRRALMLGAGCIKNLFTPLTQPPPKGGGADCSYRKNKNKESPIQTLRGNRIAMVFQEPMTSLNPLHTIEKQINEVLFLHKGLSKDQARARTLELLRLVALPDPEKRLSAYPHELSGGQRQRVMIAMALANAPDLIIADEPTTALDVTIQAQILDLLKELQAKLGMALLLITHDLNLVRRMAQRVCVMQKGEIVEQGAAAEIFAAPKHPYTQMLLASEPKGSAAPINAKARSFSKPKTSKSTFRFKKASLNARSIMFAPWTAGRSRFARAKRSASSASPDRAKRRSALPFCAYSIPKERSLLKTKISKAFPAQPCVPCGAKCRSCFKIPTVSSVRA
jgi:microcin C transport system ATP-binding protein